MDPRLDWEDLRLFLGVTRAKNLADAARAMGVDASTLSRRVGALERSLGAALFLRTREGLRLSIGGDRLRLHVEKMEAEAQAAALSATAAEGAVAGVVRLATTDALALFLVESGLCELRTRYPDLVLEVLGGNASVDLGPGPVSGPGPVPGPGPGHGAGAAAADIALRVTPPKKAGLRARRIVDLDYALFASPEYLRGRGRPRSAADLDGHDVLLPGGELAGLPDARWLGSRPGVRVVFRSNSLPAMVAAAVRGHGLVVLTRAWGDREPGLERVFLVDELPKRRLWLVIAPGARERAAVRVVADHVLALLRPAT
jgi:DNA-binding transcriptional LysR family regulator